MGVSGVRVTLPVCLSAMYARQVSVKEIDWLCRE